VENGGRYLGICLGSQLLARALGGRVSRHEEGLHEIGYVEIAPTPASNGFLPGPLHVYHWHNEGFEVPATAQLLATGPVFPNQAFRYGEKAYGIQFHPEMGPEVTARWMREAAHMLEEPGAQPAERQMADAKRYDPGMEAWLRGFLNSWLG
jgi:GMP synthase (glutamine-hydrolysing)